MGRGFRPWESLRNKIAVALCYVSADALTIRRRRAGKRWRYIGADGAAIADPDEVARLDRIALPPAYREARFCADPDGHLQAVGCDARGRRQYRYHLDFRAGQEAEKFDRCRDFGLALPRLRRRLEQAMSAPPASRDAVMAAVVQILDSAFLRIGNETYAKANRSFGVTTLRNRHAKVRRGVVQLDYRGKSGVERSVRLTGRRLLRIVRRCQDLPGQHLFQYRDDDGAVRRVTSTDVNAWLRDELEAGFTAKHFRTWHASVLAFAALREGAGMKDMLSRVSEALGNTPAVARKSYVHPSLIKAAGTGELAGRRLPRARKGISALERGLLDWLETPDAERPSA